MLTGDQCQVDIEFTDEYRSQLPSLIDEIVESCEKERTIANYDSAMIPSKESVIEILEDLKGLLFPGYFGHQGLDPYSLRYHLGNEIHHLFEKLASQISRSIRHECRRLHSLCTLCVDRGQKDALAFLKKIPYLRQILSGDVQAAYDGDPAAKSLDEIIFSYPGILAITVYRVAHELHLQGIPLLSRIMTEYAHSITGIDIHPGSQDRAGFFHRPRNRSRDRRNDRDRRSGENIPGGHLGSHELPERSPGKPDPWQEAPSHHRRRCHDLFQRYHPGRHGDWRPFRDWRQYVDYPACSSRYRRNHQGTSSRIQRESQIIGDLPQFSLLIYGGKS